MQLYVKHCEACHGREGDGIARAARYVFPRPRNLRDDRMRLVSAGSGNPTLDDIKQVIKLGMPGTSMLAFDMIGEEELSLLIETVMQIRRDGLRKSLSAQFAADGDEIDPEELEEIIESYTAAGPPAVVPAIGPVDGDSIQRGREYFSEHACESCHGATGEGDEQMPLFDNLGHPVVPCDLVHDPYKGGNEPESVYLRVFLGMPGTPHPACSNVPEEQVVDVVHYCRSLSREPERILTNHERAAEVTRRAYVTAFGGSLLNTSSGGNSP